MEPRGPGHGAGLPSFWNCCLGLVTNLRCVRDAIFTEMLFALFLKLKNTGTQDVSIPELPQEVMKKQSSPVKSTIQHLSGHDCTPSI